jgi:hypothetical protein
MLIIGLLLYPAFSADNTIFLVSNTTGNSTSSGVSSINAGTGISVNQTTGNILITNTSPESTTGSNVGNGANVFKNMTSAILYFKTILAGSGISITNGTNTITITNTSPESTTGSNVGNGANVFKNMTGTVMYYKTLLAGTGISVTNSTNTITFTNIGVTSVTGTSPISASASTGAVTLSCPTCITSSSTNRIAQLAQKNVTSIGNGSVRLNQVSGTDSGGLDCGDSAGNRNCAEKVTGTSAMIGMIVNKMTVGLRKTGSPTGICTAGVFDSSNNAVVTFGTIDSTTLTTSYTAQSFTGSTRTLASGDYVGLKCPTQSVGNNIQVASSSANPYDGTNSVVSQYSGSWVDASSWDLGSTATNGAFKLEQVGGTDDSITNFSAKRHLLITVEFRTITNTLQIGFRFNNDTGSNYADRFSNNGAADTTGTSLTSCQPQGTNNLATGDRGIISMWIDNNQSADRKMVYGTVVYGGDTAATTAPSKTDFTCKWSNTSAQITTINLNAVGGSGDLTVGSVITVWGYD